jgi:protein-tyrosine phosphatase
MSDSVSDTVTDEPSGGVRRAFPADALSILAMRDEAARWLLDRGIRQWRPGEVTVDDIVGWMTDGRVYVVELDGRVAGAVRLAWSDPAVWGRRAPNAGYVQALMTARAASGQGLGRRLLAHVEGVVAASGRTRARLSCLRGNEALERFYVDAGYEIVGARSFTSHPGWDPVTLLEKRIS